MLIAVAVLVIIFAWFGFSLYAANVLTSPLSLRIDTSAKVVSNNFEEVEFTSADNLQLKGWFFPSTSNRAIIFVTGLVANRINTEYLGPLIATDLITKGYNVLM